MALFFATRPVKQAGMPWTYEEEEELRQLYDEHRGSDGAHALHLRHMLTPTLTDKCSYALFSL